MACTTGVALSARRKARSRELQQKGQAKRQSDEDEEPTPEVLNAEVLKTQQIIGCN